MAIDPFPLRHLDLFEDFWIPKDHTWKVHHLCQSNGPRFLEEGFDIPCFQEKGYLLTSPQEFDLIMNVRLSKRQKKN